MVRKFFLFFCFFLFVFSAQTKNVLVLGDSLSSGSFSSTLTNLLDQQNFDVYYYASSGGNPYYWLDRFSYQQEYQKRRFSSKVSRPVFQFDDSSTIPKLKDFYGALAKIDYVIIQSGSNIFATLRKSGEDKLRDLVIEMISSVKNHGSQCYWILPPRHNFAQSKKIYGELFTEERQLRMEELLLEVTNEYACPAFKSRDYVDVPEDKYGDGIHYGSEEYDEWAQAVADWFLEESSKKIRAIPIQARPILQAVPVIYPDQNEEESKRKIKAVLLEKSETPPLADAPYGECLVINLYKDLDSGEEYLVKQFVFKNRKYSPAHELKIGDRVELEIQKEPEELETLKFVQDINRFDLDVVYSAEFKRLP